MNRQWLLARHQTVPCLSTASGMLNPLVLHVRMRAWCSYAGSYCFVPTIRNWIRSSSKGFHPTVQVDTPVMAPAIGWVIESNNPDIHVGLAC